MGEEQRRTQSTRKDQTRDELSSLAQGETDVGISNGEEIGQNLTTANYIPSMIFNLDMNKVQLLQQATTHYALVIHHHIKYN